MEPVEALIAILEAFPGTKIITTTAAMKAAVRDEMFRRGGGIVTPHHEDEGPGDPGHQEEFGS